MEEKEKARPFSKPKSPGKEVGIFLNSSFFNDTTQDISYRLLHFSLAYVFRQWSSRWIL